MKQALPLVAIVGRPNVGKSTLFNRLVGRRRSIVTDEPGITRDRIYGTVDWRGRPFRVVDTGGLVPDERAGIPAEIFRQARLALAEADGIVLVTDSRAGLTPADADLARRLRVFGKPLVVAANKVDKVNLMSAAAAFYELGVPVYPLSAEHGLGVDDLLDHLTGGFPESAVEPAAPAVRIAILGRPNVGKSTLLNRLVGEERSIVAAEPGTTRDAVDTLVERDGRHYLFIDTAGIRRKAKTKLAAEKLSVVMARRHLERADVALVVADASLGVTAQDAAIAGYADEAGRSLIVVMNKWDLAVEQARAGGAKKSGPADLRDEYERLVRSRLGFIGYAPVAFLSALTGEGVERVFGLIDRVAQTRRRRIPTAELNRWLGEIDLGRSSSPAGRAPQILYLTQASANPPTFVLFTRGAPKLHFSFQRFLENRLREQFDFTGSPIRFVVRAREHAPRRRARAR
ncbi:MAG TPA: ribosome biogenesis GTPase Der [Candidatus Acidoferrales bacterium]|nr:ribosome biogenesis GTPase Der [Candidatus Acidoferrales bacterium]